MKKWIAVLMLFCFMLPLAGAEEVRVCDAGRLSVDVPEGWNGKVLGESSVALFKGNDILFGAPYLTVSYYPQGEVFFDVKDYYEDVVDLEPFTAAGYEWTGYEFTSAELSGVTAISRGKDGTLYFSMVKGDDFVLSNPDVLSVLESIKVVPEVTGDWFSVGEDGTVTVVLEEKDDFHWDESGTGYYAYDEGIEEPVVEKEAASENGVYTMMLRDSTDGWYTQYFSLGNENAAAGEAFITLTVADGKVTGVSQAKKEIYDEPLVFDFGDSGSLEPASEEDYLGTWFDETSERASMEVTALEDGVYQIAVSWADGASEATEWKMTGRLDAAGDLAYTDGAKTETAYSDNGEIVSENAVYTESDGWFFRTEKGLGWVDSKEETAHEFVFVRGE